jgi:predicted NAD/FAD-binding protein
MTQKHAAVVCFLTSVSLAQRCFSTNLQLSSRTTSPIRRLITTAHAVKLHYEHIKLQVFNRPQWKTPAGRSKQYVAKIADKLGAALELSNGATAVTQVCVTRQW